MNGGVGTAAALIGVAAISLTGCGLRQSGPTAVPPRRIAVLPPCDAAGRPLPSAASSDSESLAVVLAAAASEALARNGFDVADPTTVQAALKGRTPSSEADAAALARAGRLDGAVLFIRLDQWLPNPESTMRIDAVLVALDVTLLDPQNGTVLWRAHRPIKPVPIYGTLIIGQAYVVAANAVMVEVLAPLRRSS